MRRIFLAPVISLVVACSIVMIIQTGQRARGAVVAPATFARTKDAAVLAEARHLDQLDAELGRCSPLEPCAGPEGAARVRAAIATIHPQEGSPEVQALRAATIAVFSAKVDLLEVTTNVDNDGERSRADRDRLHASADAWVLESRRLVHLRRRLMLDSPDERGIRFATIAQAEHDLGEDARHGAPAR